MLLRAKNNLPDYLRKRLGISNGDTIKALIVEKNLDAGSDDEFFFLLPSMKHMNDIYCSDSDVEKGKVIQIYRDPELGNYRAGCYYWADDYNFELIQFENNRQAIHLLDKHYI